MILPIKKVIDGAGVKAADHRETKEVHGVYFYATINFVYKPKICPPPP